MLSRPALPDGETIPYAYGLRLGTYRGLSTVSRRGHPPGPLTEFLRFPDQQFTVTTLCNSDALDAGSLARSVADLYLGSQMQGPVATRPEAPAAVVMSPQQLKPYAGVYRPVDAPWQMVPVEVRDGVLGEVIFDDVADEVFYPMTPAGDGRFFEVGRTGNVGIFTFRLSLARLEVSWNDGPVEVTERVSDSAVWHPSAAAVAEYAGTWFSPDLGTAWQLTGRGQRLVLRRLGQPDLTLRPVARDQFLRGFGPDGEISALLQFQRDQASRLNALTVSRLPGEDSVRNLGFVRLR
jgi:hypothetical protein